MVYQPEHPSKTGAGNLPKGDRILDVTVIIIIFDTEFERWALRFPRPQPISPGLRAFLQQ